MALVDALMDRFFRAMVETVMFPLRDQAFSSTRKAKISSTEQEALSSGSVGFEAEFLGGKPDWDKLVGMPMPELSAEEKAFLDGPVNELCAMLDDWKIRTELKDLPPEAWEFMKKHGFFGMIIPKEYGGLGFSARGHSEVIQKLASRSVTATVTAMVPNSLGPAELLMRYGTDEQKNYYLPRLAKGEEIPSFALTEPDAGSDASGMTSRGVVCERDGKLGILLNWEKRYITLAPITTLLGIAFKLYDPDGLLGDKKEYGITLALIPAQQEGIEVGRRHNPLGIPFQNGPTRGKDVWIPIEQIIGGRDYAGQGWRMLMECLSVGRCVSLPALSAGSSKLICRMTGAYSRVRKQFKVSINQFEGVEELLARMAGYTYMMEAARVTTLQMLDRGEHPTILSAILKYHMTEKARTIVNDGMDILGGKAICEGPDNLIAALYHGTPIGITVEGANILTRNMIIFGQGSVRSHPFLLKEIEAARLEDPKTAKRAFTNLMAKHVRMSTRNGFNSVIFGLLDGGLSETPKCKQELKFYFQHINRLSAAYAVVADMTLMLLGDSVKRKERISALLGDTMSYLYLASCTLRHFHMMNCPEEDRHLMHWACRTMLTQAEESMDRLLQNFPNQLMATGLRLVVFPRGRRFQPPSHRLDRKVAKAILEPGAARNRLTEGIFLPENEEESLAVLEQAMEHAIAAEALEAKTRAAKKEGRLTASAIPDLMKEAVEKGVISQADVELLTRAEALRRKVVHVDDFDQQFTLEKKDLKLAIADGKSLKAIYPTGTRWNLEIPRIDLVQMMEESVAQFKDQPCIDFLDKKYSYKEIGQLVNRAAAGLQAMGVKKGDKVGLYMPNSPYYPVMFFAALKAGAVAVSFCPMNSARELSEQAKDSGTRIMVTLDLKDMYERSVAMQKDGLLDTIVVCKMDEALPFFKAQAYKIIKGAQIAKPGENTETSDVVVWFRDLTAQNKPLQPVAITPDDVAMLQYTGGTTGAPKGAMLTHTNLLANVYQIEEYFKASGDKPFAESLLRRGKERALVTIPFFHIFGLTVAMLSSLKMGTELIVLPDPRNTQEALKALQDKKPTLFPSVPRLLQAMAENPKMSPQAMSHLETVISGGAALPPNLLGSFEGAVHKPGIIKQGYGLTEAAPVVASNPPYGTNKPESVGLPIPKTKVKITDPENPALTLALGEVGEICISGPQVMKGYYNREEETAAVLHDGWLRTGDLGFLDEEYYLHIVDRKKRLILVNGYNVYPTQVENAIAKHPAVAECIVISVPDSRSGEAAKALIRLKNNASDKPNADQIKKFLADYLSRIEIPKHVAFVETEILKTSVGKPDWRTLQEQERLQYVAFGDNAQGLETVRKLNEDPDSMEQVS